MVCSSPGVQALTEADKVTTERHPRAAPLLVQLGLVFARTAKVTIAEGLYRCNHPLVSPVTIAVPEKRLRRFRLP